MTTPPILEEVRRVRHEISAEIGHDPKRIREYYAALQSSVRSRTVNLANQGVAGRTKHCIEVADQPIPDGGSTPAIR
jgi:hypothetical protein